MEKIKVSSGTNSIIVSSDFELFGDLLSHDFLHKYIPLAKVTKEQYSAEKDNHFVLKVISDTVLNFTFYHDLNFAVLRCNLGSNITVRDIISVIDYCLDYVRQKSGIYNVHGSAVATKEKGVLIIGSVSGLGKTTLALRLCSDRGFSLIGDEKILIDSQGVIQGGVKTVEFNKPELNSSVSPVFNNKGPNELKSMINLQYLPVNIDLVVQPMIIPGASLYVEEWPAEKGEWHLYEELGRKIRGISRRLNNQSYPLESIDTTEISILRSETAKKLSRQVLFVCLKGDVEKVMDKVMEYLKVE